MEIERKFTIRRMPKGLEQYEREEMEQGYLCTNPVVRIRKAGERFILTYKSPYRGEDASDVARMNVEWEAELTEGAYEHLKGKIDHNLVCKTRYRIPHEQGLVIELDVFHGRLSGLAFVEVEFPGKEEAEAFVAPDWFERDVSMDGRYGNYYLSTLERWNA